MICTKKNLFLLAILSIVSFISYGQGVSCVVSGRVVDQNSQPVSYASVVIGTSDKPLTGTMADDEGKFSLKVLSTSDPCFLSVEFVGYRKYTAGITVSGKTCSLGDIVLEENTMQLSEAVVISKADAKKSTVEHTSINASSNMAASSGTALDILSASPAVTISGKDVYLRNSKNILVLLDGVPTTVDDLSSIPAANIKTIDVITNPDASYDSEGTGGIINIVSRKINVKGISGVASVNYGFNHFVAANAAVAYNGEKSSFRFSYNTRYEDDLIEGTLDRTMKYTGNRTFQKINSGKNIFNTNIGLGAEFRIDKRNNLNIDLRCMIPRLNTTQALCNTFLQSGVERVENRLNDVTWNRENAEVAINYRHIIRPKVSTLSVVGSVSKIWGHRPSYYFLEGKESNRSDSGGSPFISSIQSDYKHVFKAGTLSAGVKFTYRSNRIYHRFYTNEDDSWVYSDTYSNDLHHREFVPAVFAMFSSKAGEKFTYKVGMRGEYSLVSLHSDKESLDKLNHDFFISPSFSATYAITSGQELSLALGRRIGRPAYPQLNPYMSMVDAVTYEQGNMNLRPEKTSKADLSYSLKKGKFSLFADAYLSHSTDYISQVTLLKDDVLVTTYVNGIGDMKTGAEVSLTVSPYKWIKAAISTDTYYVKTAGKLNEEVLDNSGVANNSNIMLDFMPGKTTDIQIQYFLSTPQYYLQLTSMLTHHMNIGVRQRFLKGALTASILLTDVFNTRRWAVYSDNQVFDLTNTSVNKSRMLWLGLTYNFNSFKQKAGVRKQENDRTLIKL